MTQNFRDAPQAASPGAQLAEPHQDDFSSSSQRQQDSQQYESEITPIDRTHSETRRGRMKMLLLLLFCASPVIAS